jgi:hypothetical protein
MSDLSVTVAPLYHAYEVKIRRQTSVCFKELTNLQVIVQGMTNQNSIIQYIRNLLLYSDEVFSWQKGAKAISIQILRR